MRKIPFVLGNIYHVYNRGVAKCLVCESESDNWRFLQGLCLFNDKLVSSNILWQLQKNRGRLTFNVLKEYIVNHGQEREPLVRILAYCLMPNHFHLLVQEIVEGGISAFMHKLGVGYTGYFNTKYDRVGSLFQGTFKSVPVDNEQYLQYLLIYINVLNPGQLVEPNLKEEGIQDIENVLKFTETYLWSTHQEYLHKRNSLIIEKGLLGEMFRGEKSYRSFVRQVLEDKKYLEIVHLTFEG